MHSPMLYFVAQIRNNKTYRFYYNFVFWTLLWLDLEGSGIDLFWYFCFWENMWYRLSFCFVSNNGNYYLHNSESLQILWTEDIIVNTDPTETDVLTIKTSSSIEFWGSTVFINRSTTEADVSFQKFLLLGVNGNEICFKML